ncbi:MAG: hypothetical protein JF888_08365 [Candidatus Dormibacteraeota bacterium]|uniref:Uncharacterized protein n=1 Tax=Candidatus Dormiibacter inghamiae TaxID=3127013 RepID=A0A934NDR1_9BACT|nr:hypothetical protein [Candidatus Dormibacteraeota bacterium]MBJ7607637.1 hypothetical protein [Candidatus Dormibacteraeota bacterium]
MRLVLGGLVGVMAIVVGVAWWFGTINRQRQQAESAATYAAMGGPVFTVFSLGCGTVLILAGIGILALMVVFRPS